MTQGSCAIKNYLMQITAREEEADASSSSAVAIKSARLKHDRSATPPAKLNGSAKMITLDATRTKSILRVGTDINNA